MLRRILVLPVILAGLAGAQEFRSTLSGRITDPSGAAVPNAKVIATKSDTNSRFETVANSGGLYTLPILHIRSDRDSNRERYSRCTGYYSKHRCGDRIGDGRFRRSAT